MSGEYRATARYSRRLNIRFGLEPHSSGWTGGAVEAVVVDGLAGATA
jgi:hypothetical protein